MKFNFTKTNCLVLILIICFTSKPAFSQVFTEYFGTSIPTGWVITNGGQGNNWEIVTTPSNNYNGPGSTGTSSLQYSRHNSQAANAWAITKAVPLEAGKSYKVEFYQKVKNSSNAERLKVTVGTAQTIAAQSTTLLTLNSLTNTNYTARTSDAFVAPSTGNYYFGFNCFSQANRRELYIDYIRISEIAPVITVNPSTLDQFISGSGTPSAQQHYDVSGQNIQSAINIVAPGGFEISLAGGNDFAPQTSITLNAVNNSVPSTRIYVRSNSADANHFSGNIVHTSGSKTVNLPVTGNNAVCNGVNKAVNVLSGILNWAGLSFPGGHPQACDNVTINFSAGNLFSPLTSVVNLNAALIVNNLTLNVSSAGFVSHNVMLNTNGHTLHVKGNLTIQGEDGSTAMSKLTFKIGGSGQVIVDGNVIMAGNRGSFFGLPYGNDVVIEGEGDASIAVKGNFTLGEYADLQDISVTLNGSASQAFTNNSGRAAALRSLRLAGGNIKTVSGALNLEDSVKLYTSTALRISSNDTITLLSSESKTASLSKMENGSEIIYETGAAFVVERFIPATGKAWFHLAAPAKGQTIKQAWQEGASAPNGNPRPGYGTMLTSNLPNAVTAHGYDVYTPAGSSIKVFDAATSAWVSAPSTSSGISTNTGYMIFVRGDRSVTAYNQAATTTVLRTAGKLYTNGADAPSVSTVNASQFASIANPYASAIDFGKLSRTGGVQNVFYVWDPRLTGTYGYGAFQTFIPSGNGQYSPVIPGGSYDNGNTAIESGMAFMVHATSAGTIGFSENAKSSGSNMVFRPGGLNDQLRIVLNATVGTEQAVVDAALLMYDANNSNSIDDADVRKLKNTGENISITSGGLQLTAESRSSILPGDTIHLAVANLQQRTYVFDVQGQDLGDASLVAVMRDKFTGTETPLDLDATTSISFDVTADPASKAADRFYIVFKPGNILPVTMTTIAANRINTTNVAVKWSAENEYNLQGYTIERSTDGYTFTGIGDVLPASNNHGSADYSFTDDKATAAEYFYRVKATSIGGMQQYSAIVKVSAISAAADYNVFPNPVQDKRINLYTNGSVRGMVKGSVLNMSGAVVTKFSFNVNGRGANTIQMPSGTATGAYIVVVENERQERKTLRINVL